jgi:pimeloyl-ACP methyl ester carboxylesterase
MAKGLAGRLAARVPAVAYLVPERPARLLVLAHGFPWFDGTRSDDELIEYAREAVARWADFARAHHAVLVAPAFGGTAFPGYQYLEAGSADFVSSLADEAGLGGRFSLHGHSAGGQFAGRYLVSHPERLEQVVLSAPGAYPFPDPGVAWPDGMGGGPPAAGWRAAATGVAVTVLVGDRDTGPGPADPGQPGTTRIERARAWVAAMRGLALADGQDPAVVLAVAAGRDHDEAAMAGPAQEALAAGWAGR